tara:strand:- start:3210 stop:3509 length:300 start_codon:yes stop_codon:yes gene_type:complete
MKMNRGLVSLSLLFLGLMAMFCASVTAQEQLTVSPVSMQSDKLLAELRNERVKISFLACERQGKASVTPVFEVKTKEGWHRVAARCSRIPHPKSKPLTI